MTNALIEPNHLWRQRGMALLLAAVLFALSLAHNSVHNTFPYGFHPDESGKSDQILSTARRNFRHPQLMLEVTQRLFDLGHTPHDIQDVTVLGRWTSAVFAAIGVAAICLTGYLAGGLWGALLLGISALMCSSLIVYAHYFKEDAALIMGMCLVLLATRWMMTARSRLAASVGGLACALATSGKYIGVVFIIAGLVAVLTAPAQRWRNRLINAAVLVATFALFTAAINYRAFIDRSDFERGFGYEANHVVTSHFGLALNRPNTYYFVNLPIESGWPFAILGAAAIPMLCFTWRDRSGWDVLAVLIGPAYLLVLSLSRIPNTRYLLPVVVMLHVMAGLLALWIVERIVKSRWRTTIGIAFTAIFLLIGLPRCGSVVHQFGDDSRDRLRDWLIANVPPHSIVVGDFYTGMVTHTKWMEGEDTIGNDITVRERFAATFFGPLAQLRQKGISYVAVADPAYDRYFVPQLHPTEDFKQEYDANRNYYVELFTKHKPIWQYDPEMNLRASTNPAIRLYRIDDN